MKEKKAKKKKQQQQTYWIKLKFELNENKEYIEIDRVIRFWECYFGGEKLDFIWIFTFSTTIYTHITLDSPPECQLQIKKIEQQKNVKSK